MLLYDGKEGTCLFSLLDALSASSLKTNRAKLPPPLGRLRVAVQHALRRFESSGGMFAPAQRDPWAVLTAARLFVDLASP